MTTRTVPLLLALLTACSAQIQHGLDEREANEIVTALTDRGFDARKVPEKGKKPTWAIEVKEERASDAMRVLTELKLPRPARATTRSIIQSAGLIETPAAERLKQVEAQEGDIEESLEAMDGVTTASVELVVPPAPRPGMSPLPSKASVLLRARPEAVERLATQRGELKALVAAAVDGLKPDDVVLVVDVVQLPAAAAPAPVQPGPNLRPLVVAMGVALSTVAMLLVVLALMLRRAKRAPKAEPAVIVEEKRDKPAPSREPLRPVVQRRTA